MNTQNSNRVRQVDHLPHFFPSSSACPGTHQKKEAADKPPLFRDLAFHQANGIGSVCSTNGNTRVGL